MKTVLFLGAGFSKPFGFPIMNEFFRYVRESTWIPDEEKDLFVEMQRISARSQGTLAGVDENLEHVLSIASMTEFVDVVATLNSALRRVFAIPPADHQSHAVGELHTHFVSILGGPDRFRELGSDLTIITTNYDVMAEFALFTQGKPPILPFAWESCATPGQPTLYSASPNHPAIYKLHGSLNWFPMGDKVLVDDGVATLRGHPPGRENNFSWPAVGARSYKAPAASLIVPPTFLKERGASAFNEIWLAAREALQTAERLMFIGYSFPETDTHMTYFLGSALADAVSLETIYLLGPNADDTIKHLHEQGRFGPTFLRKLKGISKPWQKSTVRFG